MEDRIKFVVLGEPTGKGRPKFDTRGKFVKAVTPKKTMKYENLVQLEYEAQAGNAFFPKEDAIAMLVTAYKPIPKSTSKRKAAEMLQGLILPGKKPDWDNIGKIVCDALNGVAFQDDAQIVDGQTIKRYAEQPRVEVEIWKVGING